MLRSRIILMRLRQTKDDATPNLTQYRIYLVQNLKIIQNDAAPSAFGPGSATMVVTMLEGVRHVCACRCSQITRCRLYPSPIQRGLEHAFLLLHTKFLPIPRVQKRHHQPLRNGEVKNQRVTAAAWTRKDRLVNTGNVPVLYTKLYEKFGLTQCCGSGSGAFYPLDPGYIFSGSRISDPAGTGKLFSEIFLNYLLFFYY
jgi:hypothetical protein